MLKTMEKLYSHKKTYHNFQILSEKMKNGLKLTSEVYKKDQMKLTITHEGNKGIKKVCLPVL